LKSVPEEFLEGGSRDYAMLKNINAALEANSRKLEAIESSMKAIAGAVAAGVGKLDKTNNYLRDIRDLGLNRQLRVPTQRP
jgi:hypothetical protein